MKKWKGDIGDKGLVALLPFLECTTPANPLNIDLGSQNFKDLRPIIKEYVQAAEKRNISVAEEFARREAIARDVTPSIIN
jgi:hypothetical protein